METKNTSPWRFMGVPANSSEEGRGAGAEIVREQKKIGGMKKNLKRWRQKWK